MRIVQYLCRFRARDGGVPRAVIDLAAALAREGHEVRLITGGADEMVPESWASSRRGVAPGVRAPAGEGVPELVRLSPWRWLKRLRGADLAAVQDAIRWCEIAHLHAPWDPLEAQIAGVCRAAERPYIVTAHGMLDDWTMRHRPLRKQLFLRLGGARMLRGGRAVHCNSALEAEQASRWVPGIRTAVAPLLVERAARAAGVPKPAPTAPPRLVFLGRLHPIKGVEDLLDAAAMIPNVAIDVAGDGEPAYAASLRAKAQSLGLADRTLFHGHVDSARCEELLRAADLMVLPSRHENFGVALVEALATATPVLTTRGVAIWRELEAGGGAVIVPTGDVGALRAAIRSLLRDRSELRAMGERGRAWASETFAPGAVIATYLDMYAKV